MIPLDPEEIVGQAIWDAMRRAIAAFSCLFLGSFFAFLSALGADFFLNVTPLRGFSLLSSFAPSLGSSAVVFFPFWVTTSVMVLVAAPNAFLAILYYIRTEEPTAKRFVIFAGIQQFCLTGTFCEWAFDSSFLTASIVSSLVLWFFSLCFFCLILFAKRFWKNKERCNHEEHLMSVAAENAAWRKKMEEAEFIPPPPSGPEPPKARKI